MSFLASSHWTHTKNGYLQEEENEYPRMSKTLGRICCCRLLPAQNKSGHCQLNTTPLSLQLTVNPKPCDAPGYVGFTGRFMDSYRSGMVFPDKHIYCRAFPKKTNDSLPGARLSY
ncbi:uncharacterized protein LJ206_006725 isoform 1-T1 [Theristicus caerulescens]